MYTDDIFEYKGTRIIAIPDDKLPIKSYKQRRTHRKKRINKKWLKRYGSDLIRDENACWYAEGVGVLMGRKTYDRLKEELKSEYTRERIPEQKEIHL